MKKSNAVYGIALFVIATIVSFVIAVFLMRGATGANRMQSLIILTVIIDIVAYCIMLGFIRNIIFSANVKKLEKTFEGRAFQADSIFHSGNCNFYMDNTNKRIGAITKSNPFELQIVDAAAVEKAWVDNGSGMSIAGTRLVRFCFTLAGKNWKIPTFSANVTYSLSNPKVVEAVAKAEHQVNMILSAKQGYGQTV